MYNDGNFACGLGSVFNRRLRRFFMLRLKNKKCLVYGMGESGRSAIKLLTNLGAKVFFYDDDIKYAGQVGYVRHIEEEKFDLCVVSPGVKYKDNPYIEILKKNGSQIMSEIDLACLFCKGKIIAVTGTNGKTTTCMLLAKILKEAGYDVHLCGNIGIPFTSICLKTNKKSVVVCEVSSFQLASSSFFKCDIGAILNIKPDHLDVHGTFLDYIESKKKLIKFVKKKLVLNLDDDITKRLINTKNCLYFSKKTLKKGVFIEKNAIFCNKKKICDLKNFNLKGEKNIENLLASVACLCDFNIPIETYNNALKSFQPSSHRIEIVGEHNEVLFVDDSKATNVASTINALTAFQNKNIILLLGGRGKDAPYDEIFDYKLKEVVCFGEDGDNIYRRALKNKAKSSIFEKFDEAVEHACQIAKVGDVVLLSPACASFDEFTSYAERGERFKDLVLRLIGG